MELGTEITGPIAAAQRAAVEALLAHRALAPRQRERLEMVKAAWLGADIAAIAQWSGRTPKADGAHLAALATALDTPPRSLGLPFDVWSSRRLSAYLAETTDVRIAPGWLRVLLHRERFACGRPKHTLAHLQDPEEVAAREERLQAAGEKGGSAAGALRVSL
jgi:transposase